MENKTESSDKAHSEPLKKCDVSSSAYNDLAKFINKSHERVFNDTVMRIIITEIKLKSGDFNEFMIIPRYFNKSTFYQGVEYKFSAKINELLNKKAVMQAKKLVEIGSKIDFKSTEQLRNWISDETGINSGSLASLFE